MPPLLPSRFLFRFSVPIRLLSSIPHIPKSERSPKLLNLPEEYTLPDFAEFELLSSFGELRVAWNSKGLGFSLKVSGKKNPVQGKPDRPWESDGLHLWIDTRNTQSIHRASRFCHHFAAVPTFGTRGKTTAVVRQLQIPRAREESSLADSESLLGRSEELPGGYLLEAWLPAEALHGFDPDSYTRLGFYYFLRDSELGEQYLSVNQEFPFATDPSLWWTLELKT